MRVVANKKDAICTFSFTSYNDCVFMIDWGDGYVEKVNNGEGGRNPSDAFL